MKAFELAERLGMTYSELSVRMTFAELLEWIEYDQCHIPDAWYHTASILAMIRRVAGDRQAKPKDHLPKVKSIQVKKSISQLVAMCMARADRIIKGNDAGK